MIPDVPLIAHRLGREPGPDSSRAALAATLDGFVDGLETDVCLTADGRLALVHDPWLSGGTTAAGWVHETDWGELCHARLLDRHGSATSETPMLLEELLDRAPAELSLQIEVKAHGDPDLARATAEASCRVLHQAGRRNVEILSFYTAACEQAARSGLPARLVVWADYAPDALIGWAARAGSEGSASSTSCCGPHWSAASGSGGSAYINDVSLAKRAFTLGVDAITTDRPAALHHQLAAIKLAA